MLRAEGRGQGAGGRVGLRMQSAIRAWDGEQGAGGRGPKAESIFHSIMDFLKFVILLLNEIRSKYI